MWTFAVGEWFARFLLVWVLPRRWSDRIRSNCAETTVVVLRTGKNKTKPRIATLIEGVGATLLFDLALFGTNNFIINGFIRAFTKFQNAWDTPFRTKIQAKQEVRVFCRNLGINQEEPWLWDKEPNEYTCLNDFFSRTYNSKHFPPLGNADFVSPACCTLTCFRDNRGLESLLIKACDYKLSKVGLYPIEDMLRYGRNHVLLGYLSPSDYHRVHSPVAGKCIHQSLEGPRALSASVKFFNGKFNILNHNKRLVIVMEKQQNGLEPPLRIALVVVGGVGVNTIVYPNMLGQDIAKGQEVATFRAGGSAIVVFSNHELNYQTNFLEASEGQQPVEVLVGESLANFS